MRLERIFRNAALLLFAGVLLLVSAAPLSAGQAKYVFLMIGDGMGIPQRTAAEQYSGGKLLMNTFPAQGITTTHAADRFITGSAAAGTAIACGQKTNIGVVGMDPGLRPLPSIAEMAKSRGMKVGIVSSVSIDHATPAVFYAHVPKRSQYYDIAVALAESGFDYFGGGGLKDPENRLKNSEQYKGNALDLARKKGYTVVRGRKEFLSLPADAGRVIAVNGWLQDGAALPYDLDRRSRDISLAEFTKKGIELLDNEKGFFLMVEGGKIDWACHANDGRTSIQDTLAFDRAVEAAYAFYENHPEETLIVVTGDHECGGMTIGFAGTRYDMNFDLMAGQKVSFQKFSAEIMGAFKKSENPSFAAVQPLIEENFGLVFEGDPKDLRTLKPHEKKKIRKAFQRSLAGDTVQSGNPETYLLYGGYDPLTVTLTHILNQKAGLGWTSYKHTGVPVSTSAVGAGAEAFSGAYDNTDIGLTIMAAMGFPAASNGSGSDPQTAALR